ncbi:MAG: hemolysin III family protein [Bdellovibrionota bacterium]
MQNTKPPITSVRSIRFRHDHTFSLFLKRTVSAQIHLFGLLLAAVGLGYLLYLTWNSPDRYQFWAATTFGVTSIMVFGTSTLYHFLSDGLDLSESLSQLFEDLDHFSIYLFIAGTYTPVILNTVKDESKLGMIALVWGIAIAGILYTHFKRRLPVWARHRFFSTGIFVAMGWLAVIKIQSIIANLSDLGFAALVLGGLSYTVGAVIYASKRPILIKDIFGFHELWHVMVLGGFFFHYFVVLSFYRSLAG